MDSTPHIIILYQASHSVSNFPNRELNLFTDSEKFLFIENSIRSGISVVSHRHVKANNPLVRDYDHNSPTPTSLIWMLITFTVER